MRCDDIRVFYITNQGSSSTSLLSSVHTKSDVGIFLNCWCASETIALGSIISRYVLSSSDFQPETTAMKIKVEDFLVKNVRSWADPVLFHSYFITWFLTFTFCLCSHFFYFPFSFLFSQKCDHNFFFGFNIQHDSELKLWDFHHQENIKFRFIFVSIVHGLGIWAGHQSTKIYDTSVGHAAPSQKKFPKQPS